MLSAEFRPASWRGTTNTDGKSIGVSFDTASGEVIRLKLDVSSARNLFETLREYLDAYGVCTNSQSIKSVGSPNCEGSPHEGQKQ